MDIRDLNPFTEKLSSLIYLQHVCRPIASVADATRTIGMDSSWMENMIVNHSKFPC